MEEKVNISRYIDRTDNKYFPNTPEGWKEFMWRLHFIGGRGFLVAMHLDRLEKEWKRNNVSKQNS